MGYDINKWTLLEYRSPKGDLPISSWYENLSKRNREKARASIRLIRQLNVLKEPHFKKFRQLWEARWYGERKVPHRIFLDTFPDTLSPDDLIFLCGCTHKNSVYNPPKAYDIALGRNEDIQKGWAGTNDLTFDQDKNGSVEDKTAR